MSTAEPIDGVNGRRRGGSKPGRKLPPRKDGFAGGKVNPADAARLANAKRWGTDRRTLVALCQEVRPEAFGKIVELMRTATKEEVQRDCAALVLAYSDGRPRQSMDISVGPREISALSTVELEAIARGSPPPFQLTHNGEVVDAEVVAPLSDRDVALAPQGKAP